MRHNLSCLTIFFVLILKYLWKYQNPSVLIVDVMACARPRYVFCRKLKENLSFWHIATKVPVVFSPCIVLVDTGDYHIKLETHIGKQEEREKVDEGIR